MDAAEPFQLPPARLRKSRASNTTKKKTQTSSAELQELQKEVVDKFHRRPNTTRTYMGYVKQMHDFISQPTTNPAFANCLDVLDEKTPLALAQFIIKKCTVDNCAFTTAEGTHAALKAFFIAQHDRGRFVSVRASVRASADAQTGRMDAAAGPAHGRPALTSRRVT
jgi:hypothetical protein